MSNRYFIDGLLNDLVLADQSVAVVCPTWDVARGEVFQPLVRRIKEKPTYSIHVRTITLSHTMVITDTRRTLRVLSAGSPRSIEGSQADVWVLYRRREWPGSSLAITAVIQAAQRNGAETVEVG